MAVLHHIPDADDPYGIVARLARAVAPGSYLVLTHPANDIDSEAVAEVARRYNAPLLDWTLASPIVPNLWRSSLLGDNAGLHPRGC